LRPDRRKDANLKESEERLRLFVEHAPAAMAMFDHNMCYLEVSRRWYTDYRLGQASIIGKSHYEVFPEIPERWKEIHRKCLEGTVEKREEDSLKRKDGTVDWIRWEIHPWHHSSGDVGGIIMFTENITERKALEEQLIQAQKMEAVGRLAGGIAHDFNNLLTVINGYSDLILKAIPADNPIHGEVEEIQKAADRAVILTQQLLAFSHRQVIHPEILNVNQLIFGTDKMLRRLIGEDVELVTIPAENLKRVKADGGQLEQVLMNLAVNARDAMKRGGKLTIQTANAAFDEDVIQRYKGAEVKGGDYVMIAVSDTGSGMTEDVKRHIFEPFFTTKEKGKGTGLGLATCYGIVKQAGGFIWAYSEVGRGTTMKIYLPSVEGAVSPGETPEEACPLPRGTETILLVEDEKMVRDLAERILMRQGYQVLVATHGEEAFRLAQTNKGREIHLLLTDLVMPHMGGKELAEKLKLERPQIKVLITSGYTDETLIRQDVIKEGTVFLQKPFTPLSLAQKVREALDVKTAGEKR
jgi:PAS domain S-box-containing protein